MHSLQRQPSNASRPTPAVSALTHTRRSYPPPLLKKPLTPTKPKIFLNKPIKPIFKVLASGLLLPLAVSHQGDHTGAWFKTGAHGFQGKDAYV